MVCIWVLVMICCSFLVCSSGMVGIVISLVLMVVSQEVVIMVLLGLCSSSWLLGISCRLFISIWVMWLVSVCSLV